VECVIVTKIFRFATRTHHAPRHDRDTELLRAELFSLEQLKRHALTLAGQQRLDPRPGPDRLLPQLADNARVLLAAYDLVIAATARRDNGSCGRSLAARQLLSHRTADRAGAAASAAWLQPAVAAPGGGPIRRFPRIYDVALQLISHTDGRVDSDTAIQFVAAYQSVEPLKLGELWAFPIMLQLALSAT